MIFKLTARREAWVQNAVGWVITFAMLGFLVKVFG